MGIEIEKGRQQGKTTLIFVFYRQSTNLELGKKKLEQLARQNRIETEEEALEEIQQEVTV